MLTAEEKNCARDLLSLIAVKDLYSLVATTTNNLVQPCNIQEAIDCILQHSGTVESLLTRKKVSRDVLFQYLHKKKVDVDSALDKKALLAKVLEFWNAASSETRVQVCNNSSSLSETNQVSHVNDLATKFSEWFYRLLNNSANGEFQAGLEAEHFWPNCNLALRMESAAGCLEHFVQENSGEAVQLLCATCTEHKLFFNPNLTSDGVLGQEDSHGLVTVMTCGTLHANSVCVGVFEQSFGLIRDPCACNNWKIKASDLHMKAMSLSSIPTLQTGIMLHKKLCLTKQ